MGSLLRFSTVSPSGCSVCHQVCEETRHKASASGGRTHGDFFLLTQIFVKVAFKCCQSPETKKKLPSASGLKCAGLAIVRRSTLTVSGKNDLETRWTLFLPNQSKVELSRNVSVALICIFLARFVISIVASCHSDVCRRRQLFPAEFMKCCG